VFSEKTSAEMRQLLRLTVTAGTGRKADAAGYRVGGKTGTAYKQENGGYQTNKYISSFVGFAPVSKPRIVVAVMIDEPSAGKHYGGEVAAPIFARVTGETLRAMRVAPDAPFATLIQPVDPVRESL
jgi:cell division protein FtsI (penicillin-binding protein 3)